MSDLLLTLKARERRGSKPRCHLLTHGSADAVAARLTALAAPYASVTPSNRWMPQGFAELQEAQLHKAPRLLNPELGAQLRGWWLPPVRQDARTPNFDVASSCTIEGTPGLLLVEAKAHDEELKNEAAGRSLTERSSAGRKASHGTIGDAIQSARIGLAAATQQPWQISRDSHYQMSNRFAWAWKLTDLGIPVVLVYLGFLEAGEMADRGEPFADHDAWDALVRAHSAPLCPAGIWNRRWLVNGVPFVPLIRSVEQPLDREIGL